jgi:hypothetical protein
LLVDELNAKIKDLENKNLEIEDIWSKKLINLE